MKAIAGDDPTRSIEQNIIDVMHRTGGRFNELQELKDRYAVAVANNLDAIPSQRKGDI